MQQSHIKYKIRPGTNDWGKEYEYKMTALFLLRYFFCTSEDAWIAFNVDDFGAFDDVVLHVGKKTYVIQLKHQDCSKPIKIREFFTSPKGDFYLKKYVRDISKLKCSIEGKGKKALIVEKLGRFDDVHFILYTNRSVDKLVFLDKTSDIALSNFNSGKNGQLYRFNFSKLSDGINLSDAGNYKNFYLFADQSNAKLIDKKILEEIRKILKTDNVKIVAESFIKFVTEWAKGIRGGHYCLTKTDVVSKLTEFFVSQYQTRLKQKFFAYCDPCNRKFMWNEIIRNKSMVAIDTHQEVSKFLLELAAYELSKYCTIPEEAAWCYTLSEEEQNLFYQTNTDVKVQMLKIVGNHGKITLWDIYKSLWMTKKLPLILEIDSAEHFVRLFDVLKLSNYNYQVILLNSTKHLPASPARGEVKLIESLEDFDGRDKNLLLKQSVKFQGRKEVVLGDLVDDSMFKHIRCRDIVDILLDNFNICGELPVPPELYIKRFLSIVLVSSADLQRAAADVEFADVLLIEEHDVYKTPNAYKLEYIHPNNIAKCKVISCQKNACWSKMERLTSTGRTVHRFVRFDENYFQWLESYGCAANIKGFLDDVKPAEKYREAFDKFPSKTLVISSDAGMGKTTAMDYIAYQAPMDKWVLRIDLNKHRDYYRRDDCSTVHTEALKHLSYFKNALCNGHACNIKLSNAVFKKLAQTKNVAILLDGFDEISISYKEEVTNILRALVREKYQILVTTRTFMKFHLEEQLNTYAVGLAPFTKVDQEAFLTTYYLEKCNGEKNVSGFVKRLLDGAKKCLNNKHSEFTSTPLHIQLLADEFTEKFENYLQGVQSFINDSDFDLIRLYQNFIDKKNVILCNKFGPNAEDTSRIFLKYQKICALKIAFSLPDSVLNVIDNGENLYGRLKNDPGTIELLQKEGVITADEKFNINFVHQTFAEVLGAQWLFQNLDHQNERMKEVAQDMYRKRFSEDYKFLFNIFERYAARGNVLHQAIIDGQVQEAKDIITSDPSKVEVVDRFGRSAIHLIALCGVCYSLSFWKPLAKGNLHRSMLAAEELVHLSEYPKDGMAEIIEMVSADTLQGIGTDMLGYSPLDYAVGNGTLKIANEICQKLNSSVVGVNVDIKFKKSYIAYCAFYDYTALFDVLLPYFAFRDVLLKNISLDQSARFYFNTVLGLSSDLELESFVITRYIKQLSRLLFFSKKIPSTPIMQLLHLEPGEDYCSKLRDAIVFGKDEIASKLLDECTNINQQDELYNTALHYAVLHGKPNVVRMLLAKNADSNLQNFNGETAFHYAVKVGYKKTVVKLVTHPGTNVDVQDSDGNTPLHLAVMNKHLHLVNLLISHGAGKSLKNRDGNTMVHCAVDTGIVKFAKKVLENCDSFLINLQNNEGNIPLHQAVKLESEDMVQLLLLRGADVHVENKVGRTALHEMASTSSSTHQEKKTAIVKLLLEHSSCVEKLDHEGRTPLLLALSKGNVDIAQVLISEGAGVGTADMSGKTAIHYAAQKGLDIILPAILEKHKGIDRYDNHGNTPLHLALRNEKADVAVLLISHGASVTAADEHGNTAVHIAADNNLRNVLAAIWDRDDCVPEKKNYNGNTPLHLAVKKKLAVADLLIDYGADAKKMDKSGKNALDYAIEVDFRTIAGRILYPSKYITINYENTDLHLSLMNGSLDTATELLLAGVNINVKNKKGETALHLAVRNRYTDIAKIIVSHGGVVNEQNMEGNTPLHLAVADNQLTMVDLLLRNEADPNLDNNDGRTPLHEAVYYSDIRRRTGEAEVNSSRSSFQEIVAKIIDYGGDVDAKDKDGNTPLYLAVEKNCVETVKVLLDHYPHIDKMNRKGQSARHLIYKIGNDKMISLFEEHNIRVFMVQSPLSDDEKIFF